MLQHLRDGIESSGGGADSHYGAGTRTRYFLAFLIRFRFSDSIRRCLLPRMELRTGFTWVGVHGFLAAIDGGLAIPLLSDAPARPGVVTLDFGMSNENLIRFHRLTFIRFPGLTRSVANRRASALMTMPCPTGFPISIMIKLAEETGKNLEGRL